MVLCEYNNLLAFSLWTKMLNNLRLVRVSCLILTVFTISEICFYPLTKSFSGKQLFSVITGQNLSNNFMAPIDRLENLTRETQQSKKYPKINFSHELYQLVEKYEQEKLPSGADVQHQFKRILFWNDVR